MKLDIRAEVRSYDYSGYPIYDVISVKETTADGRFFNFITRTMTQRNRP